MNKAHLKTGLLALVSLLLVLAIISFPKQAFEGSLRGLALWWEVVFPALLPFFITSELLMGFGVVHFMGVLLEPLMRPLFGIPGVGGFVLSMGLASGYPMGAKLTVRLREQNLLTQIEGERLVSMASTSGPLFMIGAVAVGFFHDARLGLIIALSHYLGAFCVGLLMRFHHRSGERGEKRADSSYKKEKSPLFKRALVAMHKARLKDGRPFGQLMGDAVTSSIQTLLLIGGFIIIFSVFNHLLHTIGLAPLFVSILRLVLSPFGIEAELVPALFAGLFEITLGSQLASEAGESISMVDKVAVASAIIAFSGFSVHAQVASLLSPTDIRYLPYLFARFIHSALAAVFTYLLWNVLYEEPALTVQPAMGEAGQPVLGALPSIWASSVILDSVILLMLLTLVLWAKRRTSPPIKG